MEKFFLRISFRSSFHFFSISALIFLLQACSAGSVDSTSSSSIDTFSEISGSFTSSSQISIAGTGVILFNQTLSGVNSTQTMDFTIRLLQNSSSITIVNNAANTNLSDGIQLSFSRSGLSISSTIKVNSNTISNVVSGQTNLLDPLLFKIRVQVQDLGTAFKVYVWDQSSGSFTTSNTLLNSTTDLSPPAPSDSGNGNKWGLILNNAQVDQAQLVSH